MAKIGRRSEFVRAMGAFCRRHGLRWRLENAHNSSGHPKFVVEYERSEIVKPYPGSPGDDRRGPRDLRLSPHETYLLAKRAEPYWEEMRAALGFKDGLLAQWLACAPPYRPNWRRLETMYAMTARRIESWIAAKERPEYQHKRRVA